LTYARHVVAVREHARRHQAELAAVREHARRRQADVEAVRAHALRYFVGAMAAALAAGRLLVLQEWRRTHADT
jgi:hypothetical protein